MRPWSAAACRTKWREALKPEALGTPDHRTASAGLVGHAFVNLNAASGGKEALDRTTLEAELPL